MKLWKLTLSGLAVILAVVTFEEASLRIRCFSIVELEAEALETDERWTSDGPVWARVHGLVPTAQPLVITSETGQARGSCLILSSPAQPQRVLAAIFSKDGRVIRDVLSGSYPLEISGLGYVPESETRAFLRDFARDVDLRLAPSFRVFEPGERPLGLLGFGGLLILGAGVAALIVLTFSRAPMPLPQELRERIGSLFPWSGPETEPLPDEFKVRVRHIMDDVWQTALESSTDSTRA